MRVVILGTTGAGKSSLAEIIAKKYGLKHIELDAFRFESDWKTVPDSVFREKVKEALDIEGWVADGNYGISRDIVWSRADHIIWLDLSIWIILWRLMRRTFSRVYKKETLWQGQRESLWMQFFTRQSLFLYALKTHWRRRSNTLLALDDPKYCHLSVVRFTSPKEVRSFIANGVNISGSNS